MENGIITPSGAVRGRTTGNKFLEGTYLFFPLDGAAFSAALAFFSAFFFFCFPKSFLDIAISGDIDKFILNDDYRTVLLEFVSRSDG